MTGPAAWLDTLKDGGEESVARMDARNCSQIRPAGQQGHIFPSEFSGLFECLQFRLAIESMEVRGCG